MSVIDEVLPHILRNAVKVYGFATFKIELL